MTRLAAYEKQGRKPRSTDVPGTSAYVKSKLQRIERSDSEAEKLRRQKEYSRSAIRRSNENLRRDQEPGGGSGEAPGLPGVQPGASLSDPESTGRVDGNKSTRKGKKGRSVSQDSGSQHSKRGAGSDGLLS